MIYYDHWGELVSRVRLNWQIKTLLPVALVLLNGLLLFVLVTLTLQDPAAQSGSGRGDRRGRGHLRGALHGTGGRDSSPHAGVAEQDCAECAKAICS